MRLRKAWIGWWLDGRWCPTRNVRDHALRKAYGPTAVIRVEMAAIGYPIDHLTDEQLVANVKRMHATARRMGMSVQEAQRNMMSALEAAQSSWTDLLTANRVSSRAKDD